jgi:hypothetical protein
MCKKYLVTLIVSLSIFLAGNLMALPSYRGIRLVTPDGKIVMSFKNDSAVIGSNTYSVERWGANRLKLKLKSSEKGVFLKLFGPKLMIRDNSGNLLHIILKDGNAFRVDTPIGAHLVFMRVLSKKVVVFRKEGHPIFTVTSGINKVIMKDKDGKIIYTLKGDTAIYPASFLLLDVLSPEERVACYLLYRKIPLIE